MAKHKFYQLKPVQVIVLRTLAGLGEVFTLLEPITNSTAELKEEWVLAQDMIKLGLVSDIKDSLSVREKAKATKMVPGGRNYIVLGITEIGRILFDYCDDPDCNNHPKGDHRKRLPC